MRRGSLGAKSVAIWGTSDKEEASLKRYILAAFGTVLTSLGASADEFGATTDCCNTCHGGLTLRIASCHDAGANVRFDISIV